MIKMPSGRTQIVTDTSVSIALGTLASVTSVKATSKLASLDQGFQLKKLKAAFDLIGYDSLDARGPLIIGLCNNLSNAEIAEFFSAAPQRFEDPAASEQANRHVFPVWYVPSDFVDNKPLSSSEMMLSIIHDLPSWIFIEEEILNWFVFNTGGAALATGATVRVFGVWIVDWQRD